MTYIRTSAGGIMRIKFKSDSTTAPKKQTSESKVRKKLKKNLAHLTRTNDPRTC